MVHRSVPRHISGLSEPVSVHVLVVLMEDGGLSHSPLSVGVLHRGVLRQNSCQVPEIQVWHVDERLSIVLVIVKHKGSLVPQTSS